MKAINAYLFFNGDCRQAMEFYHKCLGGELQMMKFSDAPHDAPQEAKDRIIHARLAEGPAVLMASDSVPSRPVQEGSNFSVAVACGSAEEIERLFQAFSQGARITMPLHDAFWGARFGMLTDQFGINWMFNYEQPRA